MIESAGPTRAADTRARDEHARFIEISEKFNGTTPPQAGHRRWNGDDTEWQEKAGRDSEWFEKSQRSRPAVDEGSPRYEESLG